MFEGEKGKEKKTQLKSLNLCFWFFKLVVPAEPGAALTGVALELLTAVVAAACWFWAAEFSCFDSLAALAIIAAAKPEFPLCGFDLMEPPKPDNALDIKVVLLGVVVVVVVAGVGEVAADVTVKEKWLISFHKFGQNLCLNA